MINQAIFKKVFKIVCLVFISISTTYVLYALINLLAGNDVLFYLN